ncbi:unnamed protein product [Mytilus edulis]|uniref:Mutator-like transposase domain-containing protein n=1 Tax=Mytilus edulis TaxID=6550 RepID=A0A8S3RD66_MYTED|nr:unnamed protein product [Mytilus edulis]
MDSPTILQNTYQVIENEINSWWKEVVEREMSVAMEEEKKIAIDKYRYHAGIPSVTVICDGGWSKRSHIHTYNALGGVAVIIEAETKKNITCRNTKQDQNQDDDSEVECEDIFQEQSEFWDAGTSLQAQEDSRGNYNLNPSDLQLGMRQDLSLLLNNVAKKSSSLIGNFTTNLAECWMHIRSKFDGGKMLNHCNRDAWHTRCYAGALRFNIGPNWSQNNTYQVIENEINSWLKEVVEREMSVAMEEEKKIAIDKYRYHAGIRNKYCYICNRNESLGTTPKQHECFKNWNQSSQSMESDVIVEGFLKANDNGIRYMNFIADGDSSMHAQIMNRAPVWGKHVKKLECANHITKCLR